jgi:hypothetical protein|tara:strand:- start:416 stop:556 length:141 start_codon:yes stop_codon:yes gene_type:complete
MDEEEEEEEIDLGCKFCQVRIEMNQEIVYPTGTKKQKRDCTSTVRD